MWGRLPHERRGLMAWLLRKYDISLSVLWLLVGLLGFMVLLVFVLSFGVFASRDEVVFLARTYKGHFDVSAVYNVYNFLDSLSRLENRRGVCYLRITDLSPLPSLPSRYLMDERIKILDLAATNPYDEWVRKEKKKEKEKEKEEKLKYLSRVPGTI
jgi:hypothetical protein